MQAHTKAFAFKTCDCDFDAEAAPERATMRMAPEKQKSKDSKATMAFCTIAQERTKGTSEGKTVEGRPGPADTGRLKRRILAVGRKGGLGEKPSGLKSPPPCESSQVQAKLKVGNRTEASDARKKTSDVAATSARNKLANTWRQQTFYTIVFCPFPFTRPISEQAP